MAFRNAMDVTDINMYLRSHPEKITTEPYSLGWLFKGVCKKNLGNGNDIDAGLLHGKSARSWMAREIERMTGFVHERIAETRLMPDGGTFAKGFLRVMNHDNVLRVYNEFFSPQAARRMIP